MERRVKKQVIIGFIFLLTITGASFGAYKLFTTGPTCTDSIQNGKEEGKDCGALACGISCPPILSPIQITDEHLVFIRDGEYDFVAKVFNPNPGYGASRVDYDLILNDHSLGGTFYILPGQIRYLPIIGIKNDNPGVKVKLVIKSADWQKIDSQNIPRLAVQSQNFLLESGIIPGASGVEGTIFNDSNYDFDTVDVSVVLYDDLNNVVGINKTVLRTLSSQSFRYFKVAWPGPLGGNIGKVDIEPVTNIMENANFIQNYGTQEKFQTYY